MSTASTYPQDRLQLHHDGVADLPAGVLFTVEGTISLLGAGQITNSVTATITAHSGGGQTNAVLLTTGLNILSTVAAIGDSVRLPASTPGASVTITNSGAFPASVYGLGTDTINSIATGTGIGIGVGATATFTCNTAGNWLVNVPSLFGITPIALGTNGAINPHFSQAYNATKSGVLAMTLAAPTTIVDDGVIIVLTATTANADTLTATGLLNTGSASVNLATYAAYAGASVTLRARSATWDVLGSVGITFT